MSKSASKPYVRLEKNAQKIVKAFGQRLSVKGLSMAQLVNTLIEDYERMRLPGQTPCPPTAIKTA